jgi:DNA-binding transcriptional LysR family regulator
MKLEGIATFVAIVEAGSVSGAGRELHLSKSVVSERLTELERSLGAHLIHRTTRKLGMTARRVPAWARLSKRERIASASSSLMRVWWVLR